MFTLRQLDINKFLNQLFVATLQHDPFESLGVSSIEGILLHST